MDGFDRFFISVALVCVLILSMAALNKSYECSSRLNNLEAAQHLTTGECQK